ncbi:VOC family protein [Rubritalea halochordaticola]
MKTMNQDIRKQHGAVCWGELSTTDPKAAAEFYGKVFGWTSKVTTLENGSGDYTCFATRDGAEVAGAMEPQCEEAPNYWGIYMNVDNVDAIVAKTVELGGKVLVEAFDCPEAGRIAYLADPQGAVFAVIQSLD